MTLNKIRTLLLGGVAGLITVAYSPGAYAIDFTYGSVKGSLDTTVGIQAGIRTSAQDCTFINPANGGCPANGKPGSGSGYKFSTNGDDGNINTKRWQPYTTQLQISQELQVDWENYGGFFRWKGYYDYWGSNQVGTRSGPFGPVGAAPNGGNLGYRSLNDQLRGDSATDSLNGAGFGARILDAFVYGNWEVANNPVNIRFGNQVINWGESLFIQGGINSYLGYDITALRTPGSELKNAVTPMPAIYGSIGLPGGVSFEGWYEYLWNPLRLDTVGTFFSGSDYFGPGGNYQVLGGEYDKLIQSPSSVSSAVTNGTIMLRGNDDQPSNQGQFGLKAGYYADWLNDGTDFGLYFTNFHSAFPVLAFTAPTASLLKIGTKAFASQRYLS